MRTFVLIFLVAWALAGAWIGIEVRHHIEPFARALGRPA